MKDNMGNKLVYFVSLGKISVSPKIEKTLKIEPKSEFSGLSLRTGHYYFLKLGINLKDNMGNELVYFVSIIKMTQGHMISSMMILVCCVMFIYDCT